MLPRAYLVHFAANGSPRFQYHNLSTRRRQFSCSGKTACACTHNNDTTIAHPAVAPLDWNLRVVAC